MLHNVYISAMTQVKSSRHLFETVHELKLNKYNNKSDSFSIIQRTIKICTTLTLNILKLNKYI